MPLPDDIEALKALLATATRRADEAEAKLANAQARQSATDAMIVDLKLQIAKLRREQYGASAERTRRLLDQMELSLEDLEGDAAQDDLAAEVAARRPRASPRSSAGRPPGSRSPSTCRASGLSSLRLALASPGAAVARPSFLAMLLFEKYGQHQPLNRQADRFAREGVPLSTSTLADQVGAAAFALMPIYRRIPAHVLTAERLHGDDTTVPVMAKGKTDVARLWVYVRDDRPFAGTDPPAALIHYSRDRRGEHPRAHLAPWSGIMQDDAYGGYNELYAPGRLPASVLEAGCFAHARRKFFELADVDGAAGRKSRGERTGMIYPIALEAVQRIDALFDVERAINGGQAIERPPSARS